MPQDRQREAAWIALHTPTTDAAQLARIAATHAEFAAAIGAHPNAYPELREWAEACLRPESSRQPVGYRDPAAIPLVEPKPYSQFAAPRQGEEPWHQPRPQPQPQLEKSWDYSQYTNPPFAAPAQAQQYRPQPYAQPERQPAPAPHAVQYSPPQPPVYANPQYPAYPQHPSHGQPLGPQMRSAPGPERAAGARVNVLGIVALSLLALIVVFDFFTPFAQRSALAAGGPPAIRYIAPLLGLGLILTATGLALGGVLQRSAMRMRWTAIGALVAGVLGAAGSVGSFVSMFVLSFF